MRRMKTGLFLLAFMFTLTLLLPSCSTQREGGKTSTSIKQEGPLKVFCVAQNCPLVQNFMACYPEIQIEQIVCQMNNIESINETIIKYGSPDIILINDRSDESITEFVEKDMILEFSELYHDDNTITQQNYFEGALDSLKIGENVYALPLTISTPYLIIRDEAWLDSAFSRLPENYSRVEVLDAIETELDRNLPEGYLAFSGDIWYWGADILFENSGMLDPDDWKTSMQVVDEEKLRQIVRVAGKMFVNYRESATTGYFENARINPTILNGNYLAACWSSAPQMGLLFSQCAYESQMGQEIHVVWLPVEGEERKYAASIRDIGMIGKDSQQKEMAYEVLRLMMDMEPVTWQQPNDTEKNYCPVNRQAAGQMLACIETTGADQFQPVQYDKRIPFRVDKAPLSDALKTELEEYLDRACVSYSYRELEGYKKVKDTLLWFNYADGYIELQGEGCHELIMSMVDEK